MTERFWPKLSEFKGITPFPAGGHTSCKIGLRIMQSSQNPTMIMPLRRVCGAWLTAERAVRVSGTLPVLPIEERIS